MYLYHIPSPDLGQFVDQQGYLAVDESAIILKTHGFNGEVNEEYEPAWTTAQRGYRYFTSTIRAGKYASKDAHSRPVSPQERTQGIEIKNFERWLYQRDAPHFETTPAIKIDHAIRMWMVQQGKEYDYIARKGKRIGFDIDDRWLAEKRRIAIKVTFLDDQTGSFRLIFRTDDGLFNNTQPLVELSRHLWRYRHR